MAITVTKHEHNGVWYLARTGSNGRAIDWLYHLPANGNPGTGGYKVGFARGEWLNAENLKGQNDWALREHTEEEANAYIAASNRAQRGE